MVTQCFKTIQFEKFKNKNKKVVSEKKLKLSLLFPVSDLLSVKLLCAHIFCFCGEWLFLLPPALLVFIVVTS
jgi:hypothetical protein